MERLPPDARPLGSDTAAYDHVLSIVAGDTASPNGASREGERKGERRRRRGVRRVGVIYSDIGLVGRHRRLDALLDGVESEVDRLLSENARDRVFVHAGVVAWGDRALLLPGVSGSGKSTLVVELVRRGATYLSDDYAALDAEGRVHPYPRQPRLEGRRITVDGLTRDPPAGGVARPGDGPFDIAWILDLPYSQTLDSRALDAETLGHGRAVLSLLRHAIPARHDPGRSLDAVSRAAEGARAYAGERGEAAEAAAWIERNLVQPGTLRTVGAGRSTGAVA